MDGLVEHTMPLLQSMILKLMAKDLTIRVVGTHPHWCGTVASCGAGRSTAGAIEIAIKNADGKLGSFNILQPHRWKLGKDEVGEWTLWPPRAKTRKQDEAQ